MPHALLITGNIRTFENCIESFEALCHRLNPDVFLCLSNRELDLHPYIRETYGYSRDRTLSLETIQLKLNSLSNIKKLIVVDRDEEDHILEKDFLGRFDPNKSWTGTDIFKQFYKMNLGLDAIQAYEKEQGITYDYLLKTRFDAMIHVDSVPLTVGPNELLVMAESSAESIKDHLFICNGAHLLKTITTDVLDLFMKNIPEAQKSIHTMLVHICKDRAISVKPMLRSSVNRDYNTLFDTSITIVTMFYDIGRHAWDSCKRDNEAYFKNCEKVLKQRYPLYLFTTEEFRDRCIAIRQKTDPLLTYTRIIIVPYTDLHYYKDKDLISQIQANTNTNIIPYKEPEYTKPDYIVVIFNKLRFMNQVSIENPYGSTYFQWIDFGIHDNILNPSCSQSVLETIIYKPNKLRLRGFLDINLSNNRAEFYSKKRETVSAGLVGGDAPTIQRIHSLFEQEVTTLFRIGLINQEQYVYYCLLCQYPELFDYVRIGCWNDLEASYFLKNSIRVALCMSGHLRTYSVCRDNINEKIIQPLQTLGLLVDKFLSSWDTQITIEVAKDFLHYELEPIRSFQESHNSDRWRLYSQYSGSGTCPNSVSMHYKMAKAYKMATSYAEAQGFQYDIIIRIRPDVIYTYPISTNLIYECLLHPTTIFMPYHHGRYEVVTKFISDQFFLGHPTSMAHAMTVYDTIDSLLKEECPHTGEGFLWKQLLNTNTSIKRFMFMYGLMRENNRLEPLV
jgi:hypothetical protein